MKRIRRGHWLDGPGWLGEPGQQQCLHLAQRAAQEVESVLRDGRGGESAGENAVAPPQSPAFAPARARSETTAARASWLPARARTAVRRPTVSRPRARPVARAHDVHRKPRPSQVGTDQRHQFVGGGGGIADGQDLDPAVLQLAYDGVRASRTSRVVCATYADTGSPAASRQAGCLRGSAPMSCARSSMRVQYSRFTFGSGCRPNSRYRCAALSSS